MRNLLALFLGFLLISPLFIKLAGAIANRSEIRGFLIGGNVDWETVTNLAKDYNINTIVIGSTWLYGALYPSKYVPHKSSQDDLALAIQAAHSKGIEVHALMLMFFIWSGFPKNEPIPEEWKVVNCNNETVNWADPCHPKVRELIKNLTTELATYDIDGFMFDYIRYDETGYSSQESYSAYCKEWFENDTGIKVENWPTDVCPGGKYHRQWMEWRVTPITKMVEDVRKWMLAINPDLEFSAAVFTIFSQNAYAYWRYDIGQDTANWVRKGLLDFVAPMGYTNDVNAYTQYFTNSSKFFVDGPEGKIPIVKWTSKDVSPTTPEQLKAKIEACREVGCDGWIIWVYGGPGSPEDHPDIRSYFRLIELPETFSLGDVSVFPYSSEAIITWITDKPTTSKVEYNSSSLFISNLTSGSWGDGFPYWEIKHIPGFIVQNNSKVYTHAITLKNLQPGKTYYFRVQSQDDSGIVTSKVYNFTTYGGNLPIKITGKIKELHGSDYMPVQGAIVSCNNYGNVSDEDGNYIISLPFTGSCDLVVRKFGYRTKSTPITYSQSVNNFDVIIESEKVKIYGRLKNESNVNTS